MRRLTLCAAADGRLTRENDLRKFRAGRLEFFDVGDPAVGCEIREETNRKLLNRAAPRRPFLKINTSAIVRADIERQTRALALGRQWGWFSANDCRRLLDLEPIGSEGDVYLTPLNMQSTNDEPQNAVSLEDARRAVALRAV